MFVYADDTDPALYDTEAVLKGEIRPPFPAMLDNTKWSTWKSCSLKFVKKYLLHRVTGLDNIHLTAGKAFAEGCDTFRQAYFNEDSEWKGSRDEALTSSILAAIKAYGYDVEREADPDWAMNPKSCARVVMALDSYWKTYNPKVDQLKQYMIDGKAASECSITFPLEVMHPVTGEPILWHGRFDTLVEYAGRLMAMDEKTSTSLGASWPKKWPMRGQFMGYAYGARLLGYEVSGTIIRGTAILKGSIKHMQTPVDHPVGLLDKWYDQINRDVQRMVDEWKSGKWNYNFSDGCTEYGGCEFADSCRSNFEYRALEQLFIRVWKPEDPDKCLAYTLDDIQRIRKENGFYKDKV